MKNERKTKKATGRKPVAKNTLNKKRSRASMRRNRRITKGVDRDGLSLKEAEDTAHELVSYNWVAGYWVAIKTKFICVRGNFVCHACSP